MTLLSQYVDLQEPFLCKTLVFTYELQYNNRKNVKLKKEMLTLLRHMVIAARLCVLLPIVARTPSVACNSAIVNSFFVKRLSSYINGNVTVLPRHSCVCNLAFCWHKISRNQMYSDDMKISIIWELLWCICLHSCVYCKSYSFHSGIYCIVETIFIWQIDLFRETNDKLICPVVILHGL